MRTAPVFLVLGLKMSPGDDVAALSTDAYAWSPLRQPFWGAPGPSGMQRLDVGTEPLSAICVTVPSGMGPCRHRKVEAGVSVEVVWTQWAVVDTSEAVDPPEVRLRAKLDVHAE